MSILWTFNRWIIISLILGKPKISRCAWKWAFMIIYTLDVQSSKKGAKVPFTWKQCHYGEKIKSKLKKFIGLVVRTIWIKHNDWVFNDNKWSTYQVESKAWNGLIDVGRKHFVAYYISLWMKKKHWKNLIPCGALNLLFA